MYVVQDTQDTSATAESKRSFHTSNTAPQTARLPASTNMKKIGLKQSAPQRSRIAIKDHDIEAPRRIKVYVCLPVNEILRTRSFTMEFPVIKDLEDQNEVKRVTNNFLEDCASRLQLDS